MASRKLYEAIASTIKKMDSPGCRIDPELVRLLAADFKWDNPAFNADKFYRAAGFGELADN